MQVQTSIEQANNVSRRDSYWLADHPRRINFAVQKFNEGLKPPAIREALIEEFGEDVSIVNISTKFCRLGLTQRKIVIQEEVSDRLAMKSFVQGLSVPDRLESHPDFQMVKPVGKMRDCGCGARFFSQHAGIRACDPCREKRNSDGYGSYILTLES